MYKFHPQILENQEKIKEYLSNLHILVDEAFEEQLLAFVHKSFVNDYRQDFDYNERLEFLGDGILGAIVNKLLYTNNPDLPESQLTLHKIQLVREETLADIARKINLGDYIFLSKGEEKMNGKNKDSILSDALEALIGAIFLTKGYDQTEKFIGKRVYSQFEKIKNIPIKSYKSTLQEEIQKKFKISPEYQDFEEEVNKYGSVSKYRSEIYINGKKYAQGFGTSKKKAQEEGAKNCLEKIK